MSEAKNEAEVGKENAFDEKFMMEKMSSIEDCCKTIRESASSVCLNIDLINQKIQQMGMNPMMVNPMMMGGMNPMMGGMGMNPPIANPFFSKEAEKSCRELLDMMKKNFDERMENLKKAYLEDTDPEKIRDKLKIIADKESVTTEDKEYVLDALDMILSTGVEVARILDKTDLVIIDGDQPEKKERARTSFANVIADINKISAKWRKSCRTFKKPSSSKSEEKSEEVNEYGVKIRK